MKIIGLRISPIIKKYGLSYINATKIIICAFPNLINFVLIINICFFLIKCRSLRELRLESPLPEFIRVFELRTCHRYTFLCLFYTICCGVHIIYILYMIYYRPLSVIFCTRRTLAASPQLSPVLTVVRCFDKYADSS